MLRGKSPKPMPRSSTGEYMLGSPICEPDALPPHSTSKPTEPMNSCSGMQKNWYFASVSSASQP